jgi:hypothetical protein
LWWIVTGLLILGHRNDPHKLVLGLGLWYAIYLWLVVIVAIECILRERRKRRFYEGYNRA